MHQLDHCRTHIFFGVLFKFEEKCGSITEVWHHPVLSSVLTSIKACGVFGPLGGGRLYSIQCERLLECVYGAVRSVFMEVDECAYVYVWG